MNEKKKNNWLLWVLLVLLPPIGVIYLWIAKKEFSVKKKIILTAVFTLWFIICIALGGNPDETTEQTTPASTETPATETPVEPETSNASDEIESDAITPSDSAESETDTAPIKDSSEQEDETKELTMGQQNALSKASDYLAYSAFSYSGLIEQLEFEKFSKEDATYAADNCEADWNEQAALKAQQYIDYTSFSKDGLIEQLEFDGFTKEQAEYGTSAVGY